MSLTDRNIMRPSKSTPYRGNGKSYLMSSGACYSRPLTDDEKAVAEEIQAKYGQYMAAFQMFAGQNMQKPIWFIRFEDCTEVESNVSAADLVEEVRKHLKRCGQPV